MQELRDGNAAECEGETAASPSAVESKTLLFTVVNSLPCTVDASPSVLLFYFVCVKNKVALF